MFWVNVYTIANVENQMIQRNMIDEALNKDETNEDMDKKMYKIHKLVWSSNPKWVFAGVVEP